MTISITFLLPFTDSPMGPYLGCYAFGMKKKMIVSAAEWQMLARVVEMEMMRHGLVLEA